MHWTVERVPWSLSHWDLQVSSSQVELYPCPEKENVKMIPKTIRNSTSGIMMCLESTYLNIGYEKVDQKIT